MGTRTSYRQARTLRQPKLQFLCQVIIICLFKKLTKSKQTLQKSVSCPSRHHFSRLSMRGNSLRSSRPANSMDQDSFDSFDDIEEMVMATTSMSIGHNGHSDANRDSLNTGEHEHDELPKSIIVTNVDLSVFDNIDIKANFEAMFREYEPNATFHYLRSFRRVRVDFEAHLAASRAKLSMDGTPFGQNVIHCYFLQILSPVRPLGGNNPKKTNQWSIMIYFRLWPHYHLVKITNCILPNKFKCLAKAFLPPQ